MKRDLWWFKVFRVPETANVLLAGGVNFAELDEVAAEHFQVREKVKLFEVKNVFAKFVMF